VLPARATKTLQGVIGHIITGALNADFLDRIGYVVHGMMDRKPSAAFNGAWRFTRGQRDISSKVANFSATICRSRSIAADPENMGK
jgi:hypothetical protein